jgi:MerR family transcriptional regulator, mercuric resistance operon regulatory protein
MLQRATMSPHRNNALTIGGVAKISGVGIETIRYYERIGLLAKPPRGANGHRNYSAEHVDAVIFVTRSRKLGFSLSTIRDLLRLRECGAHCDKVRAVAVAQRNNLRHQIDALRQIERALSDMVDECESDTQSYCPIIHELEGKR